MSIENCAQPCRTCATRCHRQYGDYPTRKEALELLFKEPSVELKTEYVALEEALGRITAEDVFSAFNVPNSDTATHDGFAIGIASASGKSNVLEKGEYIRLSMGERIPEEFDTMAPAEICQQNEDGRLHLQAMPQQGQGITRRGHSIEQGERVVPALKELTPFHLCILRYSGVEQVLVVQKPRVYILPVGNDLVGPGRIPGPGMVTEADGILLSAMARECGAEAILGPIIPDDEEKIVAAMKSALPECDLLVLIGGLGREEERFNDHTAAAVRRIGKIVVHGTLASAGKASLLGSADGRYILGIPGPPHAAAAVAEAFLPSIVEHLSGCWCYKQTFAEVVLGVDLDFRSKADWTPRVYLHKEGEDLVATPVKRAGDTVESFVDASAWLDLKGSGGPFKKGDRVQARLLTVLNKNKKSGKGEII